MTRATRLSGFAERFGLVGALALLVVFFSMLLPETFLTVGTFKTMITSQTILLVLALAVTIPLRAGDFDLSVGAVMLFAAAVTGVLATKAGLPAGVAVIAGLAAGALLGTINATLIVVVGIDAFIATLGSMTFVGALTYAVTGSEVIGGVPETVTSFTTFEVFGLPAMVYYAWLLALLLWYAYEFTPVGRYLLFVGGNRDASRLSGLPVARVRFMSFVLSGLISAFAGILLLGQLGAVDPSIGPQYLLPPYAAAFLGATTIQLGRFNVVGTIVALYLLVVGVTGLQLLGAASWVSDLFNGIALVVAVAFARLAGRRGRAE